MNRKRPFVRTAGKFGAGNGTPAFAARTPTPPLQARSGEFLKTCHRHVFLTEFHLIGSSPVAFSQLNSPFSSMRPWFWFIAKAKSASVEQKGPARDRAYPDTRCCRASEASRVFVPAQALCSVKRKRPFVRTAGEFGADNGVPAFAARTPTPPSQARSGEFLKTCHRHVFLTEFHLIGSNPV